MPRVFSRRFLEHVLPHGFVRISPRMTTVCPSRATSSVSRVLTL